MARMTRAAAAWPAQTLLNDVFLNKRWDVKSDRFQFCFNPAIAQSMELVRTLDNNRELEVLTDLISYLDHCCVSHHLMLSYYYFNRVVRKYCDSCFPFVTVLDDKLPLHPPPPAAPLIVTIQKERVPQWSECDVCLRKSSMKKELTDIFQSSEDHLACAFCVAMLDLPARVPTYASSGDSNSSSSEESAASDTSESDHSDSIEFADAKADALL